MIYLRFSVKSRDKELINAIFRSLHPDNLVQPQGIYIVDYVIEDPEASTLVVEIKTDFNEKFDTVKGTLDEILTLLNTISKLK